MISRVPPVWLVLAGIVSVQCGGGIAKSVFGEVSPTGLVFLRLSVSALVMLAVARPSVRGRSGRAWLVVAAFGVSLGVMNWAFYQSLARIPLGIAVTIEFLGPLGVAVAGSRRARDLVWVLLAGLGVALLGLERGELTVLGVTFALVAAAMWASYILLSAETGRRWPGFDGLAMASVIAALLLAWPALASAGPDLLHPHVVALGALVALLSSVLPYSFELVALRTMRPALLGILLSLEPAAAALAGVVVLHELLSLVQWLAIACVVAASVGATRSGAEPVAVPAPD